MKIKTFLAYQLKSWGPTIIAYLLLLALLATLTTFYRLPQSLVVDTLRFSLPLVIIWVLIDCYFTSKKIQAINNDHQIIPQSPVEFVLLTRQQRQNSDDQQQIQQLSSQQQRQFEQLELYSHEIKNTLTSLRAAAENQPQVASQTILSAVSQADYHLNMMLSDERLSLSDNDFDFEWLKLEELVNHIIKDNSAIFINRQLIPVLTGLSHVRVLTDRKWLHFCISQLLSNAIKYSPTGMTIQVCWKDNALQIIDQGPGIASSDLPRIYDNGFSGRNGHQTTKSTGMGLYLVKQVTQRLNFNVQFQSRQDRGTIAMLKFPPTNVRQ